MRKLAIKICGITNADDAALACELGADYIGLIFAKGTQRAVDVTTAKEVRKFVPSATKLVGVFVNSDAYEIASIQNDVGLDVIQFHGTESPQLVQQFHPNIRAISNVPATTDSVDLFLIDKPKNQSASIDLNGLAQCVRHSFLFAGGLNADNVSDHIARLLRTEFFAGVDVSSGIEREPRYKDHEKMRLFVQRAREAMQNAIVG